MKLSILYEEGLIIQVVGCDVEDFCSSSVWKVRLSSVRRRALEGSVGQMILFPSDLTNRDIEAMLAKLASVAEAGYFELDVDESVAMQNARQNAGIREKAAAGIAVKARSEQVQPEFERFSQTVNAMMARPLRSRQMWDAFFMCTLGKSANFSVPGSGKTASTLGAFSYLRYAGKVDRLIMVGPKSSFGSWVDEWAACFGSRLQCRVLNFHDVEWRSRNKTARRRELALNASRYDLVLLNYEMLDGVQDQVAQLASDRSMLVFDEVHKVKQIGGQRAEAALTVAANAGFVVTLTGTPIPNSFCDIYNILHLLYPDEYDSYFGYRPDYLAKADEAEAVGINASLQPFFCRTNKKCLNVPDADPDITCVMEASDAENELLKLLRQAYRETPLALIIRVLQLESDPRMLLSELSVNSATGFFDSDLEVSEPTDARALMTDPAVARLIRQAVPSSKLSACLDEVATLAEQGKSVVVWCFFRKSMFAMVEGLRKRGISASVVYGGTEQAKRDEIIASFKSRRTQVLVTNPQTLAESVSLHSVCHDAVYLEYSYNLVHLLQSKDRIHRLGLAQGQYTQYRFMRLNFDLDGREWSLDENIYKRLLEKEQRMLGAIDRGVLEVGFVDESDLRAVFEGLFD